LKGSSATSARATAAPRATGRSSGRRPPTPTSAEEFALAGPSDPPDPRFHAFRKDLADVALAGRVIASHYAEPVERSIAVVASLRDAPSSTAEPLLELGPGEPFLMLDDSRGWAWGYGGAKRRVGYVDSRALGRSAKH
jgi:hypothetical protein